MYTHTQFSHVLVITVQVQKPFGKLSCANFTTKNYLILLWMVRQVKKSIISLAFVSVFKKVG